MSSTRRKFLGVSAGAAAALARSAAAAAQAAPAATPAPTPTPMPMPGVEKKPSLLAQAAHERYGKFLTEEQGAMLDEQMAALERASARLRSFKLGNGEEPTTDFHALRSLGEGGRVK